MNLHEGRHLKTAAQPRMHTDGRNAACAAVTPAPPSDGGAGWGEEVGPGARQVAALIFGTPLSPTRSPSEGERESERSWKSLPSLRGLSSLDYGYQTPAESQRFSRAVNEGNVRFPICVPPCASVVNDFFGPLQNA